MEPLFLQLLRRFHVPASMSFFKLSCMPEQWNVVTTLYFETASFVFNIAFRGKHLICIFAHQDKHL